jgi:hypothetical protein
MSGEPSGPAAKRRAGRPGRPGAGRRLATLAVLAFAGVVCVGLFVSGFGFYLSVRSTLIDLTGTTRSSHALLALAKAPRNLLHALTAPSPERIEIELTPKRLAKLAEKREEALRRGVLMSSEDDFVEASIRHGRRSVPVKLRLKGDWTDHLAGDKWSLRIHVRQGDHLFGMRRFSLQSPETRGFQAEPIFLAHLRRESVLAPRYSFVDVTLNGKDIGLMALEEHFSKELLESQERPEGVILHLDEEPFWESRLLNGSFGPFANPWIARIVPFGASRIAESERLSQQLELATGLLRGFLAGSLPASEAFDADRTARMLAVAEVWNARHPIEWHNLRFYFDPVSARLEPIGFDASLEGRDQGRGLVTRSEAFPSRLLDDPELRRLFVRHLARIAGEMADGTIPAWAGEMERPILRTLHREFPLRRPLDLRPLVARARTLTRIAPENFAHFEPALGSPDMRYPRPLLAYVYPDRDPRSVELVNALPVPVRVLSLAVADGDAGRADLIDTEPPLPVTLPPTPHLGEPRPVALRVPAPGLPAGATVEGSARVEGQDAVARFRAEPYVAARPRSPIPSSTLGDTLSRHPFLGWDEATGRLHARPGRWRVEGSLALPPGVGLSLPAGTTLRFGRGEALVASGPLDFSGRPDAPVILEGRDDAGGEGSWAGLVVLGSATPFRWEHVVVRDTTGIDRDGWRPTGAVTFRACDLAIANSRFAGNRAEAAVHLVRSRFRFENVDFAGTRAAAVDSDFSDGALLGGRFSGIGGDGIAVSGGRVEIDGARFLQVQDEAISLGEASEVTARNVEIDGVRTGAASRDRSRLVFEASRVSNARYAGVMAYASKPEFGPAEAIVRHVGMHGVPRPAIAQTGSRLLVDGREVEAQDLDVDRLFATGATSE